MIASEAEMQACALFDRLADLQNEDVERAWERSFELLERLRGTSDDVVTVIELTEALLLGGSHDEALKRASAAYAIRELTNRSALDRLASLLMCLGQREEALVVARELAASGGAPVEPMRTPAKIAAWAGEVEFLRELAKEESVGEGEHHACRLLHLLAQICTDADFALHQRTLIAIIRDVQFAADFGVSTQGERPVGINRVIFDGSKIQRHELESRLKSLVCDRLGRRLDGRISNILREAPFIVAPSFHRPEEMTPRP